MRPEVYSMCLVIHRCCSTQYSIYLFSGLIDHSPSDKTPQSRSTPRGIQISNSGRYVEGIWSYLGAIQKAFGAIWSPLPIIWSHLRGSWRPQPSSNEDGSNSLTFTVEGDVTESFMRKGGGGGGEGNMHDQ